MNAQVYFNELNETEETTVIPLSGHSYTLRIKK